MLLYQVGGVYLSRMGRIVVAYNLKTLPRETMLDLNPETRASPAFHRC